MREGKGKQWYTLLDIAREAGYCLLPEGGAWVCLVGVSMWPRGERLIPAHREVGIQHLDIYWALAEELTFEPRVNRFRRRRLRLPQAIAHDVANGYSLEEALGRAVEDMHSWVEDFPVGRGLWTGRRDGLTMVTISHPHPGVRFFSSELRAFGSETIRMLLEEDQVDVLHFGEQQRIVFGMAARELADAYQIDGLSRAQAYQEMVGLGIMEPAGFIPQWFYRPRGRLRDQFCEEID